MAQIIETTASIFFRPPDDLANKILEVKKLTGVYYPDHEESYPHVSIYSSALEDAKYETLIEAVRNIDSATFDVTMGPLRFKQHKQGDQIFVSFGFADESILKSLHEQVLAIANPLRNGLVRNKDISGYKEGKMTEEEWQATKKYGFRYYMEYYYPHITIGVIEKGDTEKESTLRKELGELEGASFRVEKILVKKSQRIVPDQVKVFESEITEIPLS
jgi:hypothetical protein